MTKKIILITTLVLFLIIGFPILTNLLMLGRTSITIGSEKEWIGFFGGFFGAIVGGIIGGGITLYGVKLTLQNQYRKEFLDIFPSKRLIFDNISDQIDPTLELRNLIENDTFGKAFSIIQELQKNKATLLEKGSNLNSDCYESIKKLFMHVDAYYLLQEKAKEHKMMGQYHKDNKLNYLELDSKITKARSDFKSHFIKVISKYNQLTKL